MKTLWKGLEEFYFHILFPGDTWRVKKHLKMEVRHFKLPTGMGVLFLSKCVTVCGG
jgi:hypothetical protein